MDQAAYCVKDDPSSQAALQDMNTLPSFTDIVTDKGRGPPGSGVSHHDEAGSAHGELQAHRSD